MLKKIKPLKLSKSFVYLTIFLTVAPVIIVLCSFTTQLKILKNEHQKYSEQQYIDSSIRRIEKEVKLLKHNIEIQNKKIFKHYLIKPNNELKTIQRTIKSFGLKNIEDHLNIIDINFPFLILGENQTYFKSKLFPISKIHSIKDLKTTNNSNLFHLNCLRPKKNIAICQAISLESFKSERAISITKFMKRSAGNFFLIGNKKILSTKKNNSLDINNILPQILINKGSYHSEVKLNKNKRLIIYSKKLKGLDLIVGKREIINNKSFLNNGFKKHALTFSKFETNIYITVLFCALLILITGLGFAYFIQQRFKKFEKILREKVNSESILGEENILFNDFSICRRIFNEALLKKDKAYKKLEQTSKTRSEFLANISHEIRTPLNAVIGATVILEERKTYDQDLLQLIKNSGENLLNTIHSILEISKIDNNRVKLTPRVSDIKEIINKLCSTFKQEIKKSSNKLDISIACDIPDFIYCDSSKLKLILTNILSNAIKYTDHGTIRVVAKIIFDKKQRERISFSIEDTGIGIPKDKQKEILEYFTQVETDNKRSFGGLGIGLSIANSFITIIGGKLKFTSNTGVGSKFYFSIPLEPIPESKKTTVEGTKITKTTNILCVDDSEENRFLLSLYLKDEKIIFTECDNGEEAINLCNTNVFDLIIMDIQMPGMDGLTATKMIRKAEKEQLRSPVPIMALTAHAFIEDIENSLEAGCNRHITKPVSKDLLLETIADILKS